MQAGFGYSYGGMNQHPVMPQFLGMPVKQMPGYRPPMIDTEIIKDTSGSYMEYAKRVVGSLQKSNKYISGEQLIMFLKNCSNVDSKEIAYQVSGQTINLTASQMRDLICDGYNKHKLLIVQKFCYTLDPATTFDDKEKIINDMSSKSQETEARGAFDNVSLKENQGIIEAREIHGMLMPYSGQVTDSVLKDIDNTYKIYAQRVYTYVRTNNLYMSGAQAAVYIKACNNKDSIEIGLQIAPYVSGLGFEDIKKILDACYNDQKLPALKAFARFLDPNTTYDQKKKLANMMTTTSSEKEAVEFLA